MGKMLIVEEETLARLEVLARAHGVSVADELKALVDRRLTEDRSALIARAGDLRRRTAGRPQTPSEVLLRECRDEQ